MGGGAKAPLAPPPPWICAWLYTQRSNPGPTRRDDLSLPVPVIQQSQCLIFGDGVYQSGRCVFAWREGVASPTGKPGKPSGETLYNHLRRSSNGVSMRTPVHRPTPSVCRPHFARNTNRIFNILSVNYAPSWSASIRLGCICRSTTNSTAEGWQMAPPVKPRPPPSVLPPLSP